MSTCISSRGEYGSHELDDAHICTWCGVLDEDAMVAELRQLRADLARARRCLAEHADCDEPECGAEIAAALGTATHPEPSS